MVDAGQRVLYANEAAVELGSLVDRWQGKPVADACRDFRVTRAVSACIDSGHDVHRELRDVHLEGHVSLHATPVGEGERMLACVLLRDESRAFHVEAMRRDFVANVSHELRTPLTAIQLLVETLQKGALSEPEVAGEFVGKIGVEVRHMVQLVEELLELSTIESGRRPLDFSDSSLEVVLRGIERLRPLARERGVRLDVVLDNDVPKMDIDAPRLSQAIRNLVHNALKFTPEGGRVSVRASRNTARRAVQIIVRDTGVGIDSQDVPRIFERFWKADSSRQRDGEGSGLGLAIVRHVVEAHGGKVGVVSEPRHGTEFTVELPVAPPD